MEKNIFNPTDFLFRIFPAVAGGFLGAGVFLLVLLILQMLAAISFENTAFPIFAVLMISFSGSVVANVSAAYFITLANPDKYPKKRPILINAFIVTIVLFLISVPFILILQNKFGVICLFFIFAIMASAIFLELYKNNFNIGGIHGILFAGLLLSIVFAKLFFGSGEEILSVVVLIFILPFAWFFVASLSLVGEIIAALIKR